MNSTDSPDFNQPSERLHLTDDGLYPPESYWTKQDEERPETEALQQEAANQKFLEKQLEQLDAAKDFAILTLGKNDNRASTEQALAVWYVEKYGEKLRSSHTAQIVRDAALALRPRSEGLRKGDKIDTTQAEWLWDGMVMKGQFNLMVGAPKVGKSALITAMIGALARGDRELLGRPLAEECPPVILIGVDQPYSMWAQLLDREQLLKNSQLCAPIERLMAAGDGLALDEDGLDRIQQMAEEHPGALFVLDSYDALVSPLGNEEASALFARPARLLIDRLAPTGATWVVLHHTNKSVSGGSAISASRGSNALPAAASWCLLLNWLKQVPEGGTQTDFRVMVTGQGRAQQSMMLCQLTGQGSECHWEALGNPVEVHRNEDRLSAELHIRDGRQADTLDYCRERYELGNFSVTSREVASELNIKINQANRYLNQLEDRGLLHVWRQALHPPRGAGGRPSDLFVYHLGTFTDERCEAINQRKAEIKEKLGNLGNNSKEVGDAENYVESRDMGKNPSRAYIKSSFYPNNGVQRQNLGVTDREGERVITPSPGQAVEILMSNGEWQNSWIVTEGSTAFAVKVEKLGQPALTRSNLRWDVDVRPCQGSPFAVLPKGSTCSPGIPQPEPGEPGYDPNAPF